MMEPDSELIEVLRQSAKRKLKSPANVLLVAAILGCVLGGLIIALFILDVDQPRHQSGLRSVPNYWIAGALTIVWSGMIALGVREMGRLGNYRIASLAAWLALIPIPTPLWIVWLIGGIVCINRLSHPAVRAAFSSGNPNALKDYIQIFGDVSKPKPKTTPPPLPQELANGQAPAVQVENGQKVVARAATILFICWMFAGAISLCLALLAIYSVSLGEQATGKLKTDRSAYVALGIIYPVVSLIGFYGTIKLRQFRSSRWGLISTMLFMLAYSYVLVPLIVGLHVLNLLTSREANQYFRSTSAGLKESDSPIDESVELYSVDDEAQADEDFINGSKVVGTVAHTLLVCWILGDLLALILFIVAMANLMQGDEASAGVKADRGPLVLAGTIYPLMGIIGTYGAIRLDRRKSLNWGIASAVLLIVAFCGTLVSLVVGAQILNQLGRKEVKYYFQKRKTDALREVG